MVGRKREQEANIGAQVDRRTIFDNRVERITSQLRSLAVVVLEHATESLAAGDL